MLSLGYYRPFPGRGQDNSCHLLVALVSVATWMVVAKGA